MYLRSHRYDPLFPFPTTPRKITKTSTSTSTTVSYYITYKPSDITKGFTNRFYTESSTPQCGSPEPSPPWLAPCYLAPPWPTTPRLRRMALRHPALARSSPRSRSALRLLPAHRRVTLPRVLLGLSSSRLVPLLVLSLLVRPLLVRSLLAPITPSRCDLTPPCLRLLVLVLRDPTRTPLLVLITLLRCDLMLLRRRLLVLVLRDPTRTRTHNPLVPITLSRYDRNMISLMRISLNRSDITLIHKSPTKAAFTTH